MHAGSLTRIWRSRPGLIATVLCAGAVAVFFVYGPISSRVVNFKMLQVTQQSEQDTYHNGAQVQDVGKRFESRKRHLQDVCSKPEFTGSDSGVFDIKSRTSRVAFKRLWWCRVAKVGTTFMKGKFSTVKDLHSVGAYLENSLLRQPKRFLFVRDPYSRLFSCYLDKIISDSTRWNEFGSDIIRKQRSEATSKEITCGSDVTFLEFVRFVIDVETRKSKYRDIHFAPMHDLCDVCSQDYDFIGHMETMKEDLPYIMSSVGVAMDINQNTTNSIWHRFKETLYDGRRKVDTCLGLWKTLQRLWWVFQARGYISSSIPLIVSEDDVLGMSWEQLASMAIRAHQETLAKQNSLSKQKRSIMAHTFLEIPLSTRLQYADLFRRDFELFNYDPRPHDLFPELVHEYQLEIESQKT